MGVRAVGRMMRRFPSTVTMYMDRKSPKRRFCSPGSSERPKRRNCVTPVWFPNPM